MPSLARHHKLSQTAIVVYFHLLQGHVSPSLYLWMSSKHRLSPPEPLEDPGIRLSQQALEVASSPATLEFA